MGYDSHWRTQAFRSFDQALTAPSGVQRRIYTTSAKREFDGVGGWMDGWGGTGYQMGPSIFFLLCGYIGHIYIYIYIWVSSAICYEKTSFFIEFNKPVFFCFLRIFFSIFIIIIFTLLWFLLPCVRLIFTKWLLLDFFNDSLPRFLLSCWDFFVKSVLFLIKSVLFIKINNIFNTRPFILRDNPIIKSNEFLKPWFLIYGSK